MGGDDVAPHLAHALLSTTTHLALVDLVEREAQVLVAALAQSG